MKIEWFEAFLDIAKTGSLRASSNNLYLTQPALGQAITMMEKELGFPLFIRSAKGMKLTKFGESMIPYAKVILDNYEKCSDIRKEYRKTEPTLLEGSLNIVMVPTVGTGIFPSVVPAIAQKYPKISLNIFENNSVNGQQQVLDGTSDLGFLIVLEDKVEASADYKAELLWKDHLYAMMRKDNQLAGKKTVTLKTLSEYPLALMAYHNDDHTVDKEIFSQYMGQLNIAMRCNNHAVLYNYVLSTDCVALTHLGHVTEGNAADYNEGMVQIPVKDVPDSHFFAFYKKDNPKISLIRAVIDEMKNAL